MRQGDPKDRPESDEGLHAESGRFVLSRRDAFAASAALTAALLPAARGQAQVGPAHIASAIEQGHRRRHRRRRCHDGAGLMRRFSYASPTTARGEIAAYQSAREEARHIAGGTTLYDLMKLNIERPAHLIDVTNIRGLNQIDTGGEPIDACINGVERNDHSFKTHSRSGIHTLARGSRCVRSRQRRPKWRPACPRIQQCSRAARSCAEVP